MKGKRALKSALKAHKGEAKLGKAEDKIHEMEEKIHSKMKKVHIDILPRLKSRDSQRHQTPLASPFRRLVLL